MRIRIGHGLALFGLLVAAPAAAAAAADAAPPPAKPGKKGKICRDFGPPIGSRLGNRRVCATPDEWELTYKTGQQETKTKIQRIQAELDMPR